MPELDRTKPIHLIVNPYSGYGGGRRVLSQMRSLLRQDGWKLAEHTTRRAGDAMQYAADARDDAAAVIIWGGDGTISEVTNVLAGTENLLAKEMHIPLDPLRLADALKTGRIVECDVGRINDRNFLLIIGVGFDGEVVRRLTSVRTGHISHLSYFWPLWRTFWEHNYPRIRVVTDGEEVYNDYGLAFVGNISRYAVGLRICRDARFDDGLLDLVVFRCQEQTALVLHAAWTLLRRHPLKGNVFYRQFRNARIECEPVVHSQVDGDTGPDTPLDISVHPGRLRIMVPPPRAPYGLWPWGGDRPL